MSMGMEEITKLPDQARVTPDPAMEFSNRNSAWHRMTRTVAHYERFEQIGEGTYGQVYRAKCLDTGRIVALKKTRIMSSKGYVYGMPLQLIREIKILKQLQHPNLLQLIEVVTSKGVERLDPDDPPTTGGNSLRAKQSKGKSDDVEENDDVATLTREKYKGNLFLVLEYVSHDLTGLLDIAYQFSEVQIKCVFQQLLRALAFMHQHKVVHRDIKSSNILIDSKFRLKLADFGLARSLEPPLLDQMEANGAGSTNQDISYKVITLWYRPPEILLGTVHYDFKVDLWSAGCILAELIANKPLMPGKSELEQLSLVAEIVGTPDKATWDYLMSLKKSSRVIDDAKVNARAEELQMGERLPPQLRDKFRKRKTASDAACNMLEKLLEWDPRKRITAESALQNRFFWTQPVPPDNPEELGRIEVAEDGHFHEFQTKQKRREAKAIAEGKKDEALRNGATKSEADAIYDENYQALMKRVAKEGIIGTIDTTGAVDSRTNEGEPEKTSKSRRRDDPSDDSDSGKRPSRKKHRREHDDVDSNDVHTEEKHRSRRRPSEERERKERKSRRDDEVIGIEPAFSPSVVDESERRSSRDRERGKEKSKERKKSKRKESKRDRHHKSRERDERKRRRDDDGYYSPGPDHRGIRERSPGGIGREDLLRRDGPQIGEWYGPPRPGIPESGNRDGPFDRRPVSDNRYEPSGYDRDWRQDSPSWWPTKGWSSIQWAWRKPL